MKRSYFCALLHTVGQWSAERLCAFVVGQAVGYMLIYNRGMTQTLTQLNINSNPRSVVRGGLLWGCIFSCRDALDCHRNVIVNDSETTCNSVFLFTLL